MQPEEGAAVGMAKRVKELASLPVVKKTSGMFHFPNPLIIGSLLCPLVMLVGVRQSALSV